MNDSVLPAFHSGLHNLTLGGRGKVIGNTPLVTQSQP
jgi:hypothetical protein